MSKRIQRFGIVSGILAFLLCLGAGLWILINVGFDPDDLLFTGIGLYFIGKSLFVGPMLIITSMKREKQ